MGGTGARLPWQVSFREVVTLCDPLPHNQEESQSLLLVIEYKILNILVVRLVLCQISSDIECVRM